MDFSVGDVTVGLLDWCVKSVRTLGFISPEGNSYFLSNRYISKQYYVVPTRLELLTI